MPTDAQLRMLLRNKDAGQLRQMQRNPQFTAEQSAMIAEELEARRMESVAAPAAVRIVHFDMPFGSMVAFMVKWALASIPAFLILTVLAIVLMAALAALGVGLGVRPPTP